MVPTLECSYDNDYLYLVMPFMKRGNLLDAIGKQVLDERAAAHVAHEVLEFLKFLHGYVPHVFVKILAKHKWGAR